MAVSFPALLTNISLAQAEVRSVKEGFTQGVDPSFANEDAMIREANAETYEQRTVIVTHQSMLCGAHIGKMGQRIHDGLVSVEALRQEAARFDFTATPALHQKILKDIARIDKAYRALQEKLRTLPAILAVKQELRNIWDEQNYNPDANFIALRDRFVILIENSAHNGLGLSLLTTLVEENQRNEVLIAERQAKMVNDVKGAIVTAFFPPLERSLTPDHERGRIFMYDGRGGSAPSTPTGKSDRLDSNAAVPLFSTAPALSAPLNTKQEAAAENGSASDVKSQPTACPPGTPMPSAAPNSVAGAAKSRSVSSPATAGKESSAAQKKKTDAKGAASKSPDLDRILTSVGTVIRIDRKSLGKRSSSSAAASKAAAAKPPAPKKQDLQARLPGLIEGLRAIQTNGALKGAKKTEAVQNLFKDFREFKLTLYKSIGEKASKTGSAAEAYGRQHFADDLPKLVAILQSYELS